MPTASRMTEGYHKHDFSVENQAAAFAFLDRFNGMPVRRRPGAHHRARRRGAAVHATGQVLLDHPDGRSVMDEIRDYYRRTREPRRATPLLRTGYPGIAQLACTRRRSRSGPSVESSGRPAGTSTFDGVAIDKYVLHHSDGLVMPLLHLHREGAAAHAHHAVDQRSRQGRRGRLGRDAEAARRRLRRRVVRRPRARRNADALHGGVGGRSDAGGRRFRHART